MDNILTQSYLDAWRNWNNFAGRTRRSGFWYAYLATVIVSMLAGILINISSGIFYPLYSLYCLAYLIPSLSLSIRRLHDVGRSGWWLFLGLVPLVGGIVLLVWFCSDSALDNQYGPCPKGYNPYGPQGGYQGYNQGNGQGYNQGNGQGYNQGNGQGYNQGNGQGYNQGNGQGYNQGNGQGYNQGNGQGYDQGNGQGYNPSAPQDQNNNKGPEL